MIITYIGALAVAISLIAIVIIRLRMHRERRRYRYLDEYDIRADSYNTKILLWQLLLFIGVITTLIGGMLSGY